MLLAKPVVIYQDSEVLAVSKPAGLIAHSDGRTIEPSLAEWICEQFPELSGVGDPWVSPQGERIAVSGMVHRLDRTTSGVVLIAKSNAMYTYLKKEFKARRVTKKYRALVYGKIETSGTICAEIMRSKTAPRRWYARFCEPQDMRAAITDWELISYLPDVDVSYIEARPRTGRTHQLRVHFAAGGHPIVSDHLYAPDRPQLLGMTRPALHAYSIAFSTPTGIDRVCTAPLSDDFPNYLLQ